MPVSDAQIIAYLAEAYGSSLSKRALWTWSGGLPETVDFDPNPLESWDRMWAVAGKGSPPSRVALVREMLFDNPGQALLIAYLAAVTKKRYQVAKQAVNFFRFHLEKTGGGKEALPPLLFSLRGLPPDSILTVAIPALEGRWRVDWRLTLDQQLAKLEGRQILLVPELLLGWGGFYLDCFEGDETITPAIRSSMAPIRNQLAELEALVAGDPPRADPDLVIKHAVEVKARVAEIEAGAGEGEDGHGFGAIHTCMDPLLQFARGGAAIPWEFEEARSVRAALWATRGS